MKRQKGEHKEERRGGVRKVKERPGEERKGKEDEEDKEIKGERIWQEE